MEVKLNFNDSKDYGNADSYNPWDNPYNVITFETFAAIENVLFCYFNPLIFFIGVPANVLSCVVFFRQGSYEIVFLSSSSVSYRLWFRHLVVIILLLLFV